MSDENVKLIGSSNEPESSDREREVERLMGQALLESGRYEDACGRLAAAGDSKGLTTVGQASLASGELRIASNAFFAAHDAEGLRAVGERFAKAGELSAAREAFRLAGAEMTPDLLRTCGLACVKLGDLDSAREAFQAAGDRLSPEHLFDIGEACVKDLRWEDAIRAFAEAGAAGRLGLLGSALLKRGIVKEGLDAFRAANCEFSSTDMRFVGERYVRGLNLSAAIEIFRALKDRGVLRQIGETCLEMARIDEAFEAYAAASDTEGLKKVGERYLELRSFDQARSAFSSAGAEMTSDQIQAFGRRCLEQGDHYPAFRAFFEAGSIEGLREVGKVLVGKGDYQVARSAFNEAVRLSISSS